MCTSQAANASRLAALQEAEERAEAMLQAERDKHNESMHSMELSFAVSSALRALKAASFNQPSCVP